MSQIRTLARSAVAEQAGTELSAAVKPTARSPAGYQPLQPNGARFSSASSRRSVISNRSNRSTRSARFARTVRVDDTEGSESGEESGSETYDPGVSKTRVEEEDEADEEDDKLVFMGPRQSRKSLRTQSFMDRLKEKRSAKSDFGFHVNLAFKGAVITVLGNLPMLVDSLRSRFSEEFTSMLSYVGLYVVFTFWKSLGDTIAFAFQGVAGALLATVNVLMVKTVVGMTPKTALAYCFAWFDLIVFVWLILWLNFDGNTRNFALSNHVSFLMLILKPEEEGRQKNLMKTFTLSEVLQFEAIEVVNLCVVVAGTLLAVLASVLPLVPVLTCQWDCRVGDALRYAEDETRDLAFQMGRLVTEAVSGFCAQQESLVVDGLIAKAMQMHSCLDHLDVLADAAWWEGIPFMAHRSVRLRVLKDMHNILVGVLDDIITLLYALKYEEFEKSHEEMMDEIEPALEGLADFIAEELRGAMETLYQVQMNCKLDAKKKSARMKVLQKKKDLITELGEAYFRTLQQMLDADEAAPEPGSRHVPGGSASLPGEAAGNSQSVRILHETMEESHFVYRMILMVDRLITRLERQEGEPHQRVSWWSMLKGIGQHLTNPDQLYDTEHVVFAVRQSITIVVCFGMCMHYYSYSPTMVVTQALLVAESARTGSMLKRNLGRLQGVVIGTIFPHLFYDWFSECQRSHEITLAVILFFFEWIAFYVYFSSEDFGYVGCLVGAFGASAMCKGCVVHGDNIQKSKSLSSLYLIMEQNALGIAILTVIDMVFAPERASDMANRQIYHDQAVTRSNHRVGILPLLQYGFVTALKIRIHPDDKGFSTFQNYAQVAHPDKFGDWNSRAMKQLRLASKLCEEAYAEPRYMRRPWPLKLYQELIKVCQGLRVDIIALTDAIEGHALKHAEVDPLKFEHPQFKRFVHKLQVAFNKVSLMVRLALKHFDEERGEREKRICDVHEEAKNLRIPTDDDISKLSLALIREHQDSVHDHKQNRLSIRSHVLTDTFCRTSVAICVLKNSTRRLEKLHASVVDSF